MAREPGGLRQGSGNWQQARRLPDYRADAGQPEDHGRGGRTPLSQPLPGPAVRPVPDAGHGEGRGPHRDGDQGEAEDRGLRRLRRRRRHRHHFDVPRPQVLGGGAATLHPPPDQRGLRHPAGNDVPADRRGGRARHQRRLRHHGGRAGTDRKEPGHRLHRYRPPRLEGRPPGHLRHRAPAPPPRGRRRLPQPDDLRLRRRLQGRMGAQQSDDGREQGRPRVQGPAW
jgi:hypothetical protein